MKKIKKIWSAREELEARLAREVLEARLMGYDKERRANIKILAETEHYMAIIAKGECLYISIIKGKTKNDFLPDIYVEQDYKGFCKEAKINWSAYGDQDLKATKEFIDNLQEAMQIVEKIDNKDFSNIFND